MAGTIPYASVRPVQTLDLLSQREMASLASSTDEVHQLFRRCALAVLNSGAESDDTTKILEEYSSFEVQVVPEPRGLRLELFNAPSSAFVDGKMILGIRNHLFSALRDIVYVHHEMLEAERLDLGSSSGITDEFKTTLNNGLSLISFLVLPSALALISLAEPVISVVYERGQFDELNRVQTAIALRSYSYGLLCYAAIKIIQPAFYAIDRRWIPMFVSITSVGINIGLNYHFVFNLGWGHEALALTTSAIAILNFLALLIAMQMIAGGIAALSVMTSHKPISRAMSRVSSLRA